jgi:hypothetical protein
MTASDTIPVFDSARLHRQTMGDPSVQVEVLSLFVAEVERLMRQVEEAEDGALRGDRLRGLIALARNIGAMRLAQEARAAETQIGTEQPDLSALRAAVVETIAFVQRSNA